jgi:hypothetical protein
MMEAMWQGGADLFGMLERVSRRASERKLRLFACACVREVGYLLSERRVREAFYVAERFADGLASLAELAAAHDDARAGHRRLFETIGASVPAKVVAVHEALCQATSPHLAALPLARACASALLGLGRDRAWQEQARQAACQQLRDVFGNPFRRTRLDRGWLRGRGQTAVLVAGAIYEEREFDQLPVLADALEDADCPHEELVRHCRAGEHGRGCWVIDALTGRK